MRARTLKLKINNLMATTYWKDSQLIVEEHKDGEVMKRATILIEDPSDLSYLREELDKIEKYWRSRLEPLSR